MITEYLTETATWIRPGTPDQWGTPAAATETDVSARVEWKTRVVRSFQGAEVVAAGTVLMVQAPAEGDRIRISGHEHAVIGLSELQDWDTQGYEVFIA